MSCWVVPSVAAEIWGIPVIQVWERIRHGAVIHKQELGFTLVDVAPGSPCLEKGQVVHNPPPPTFIETPETTDADEEFPWRQTRRRVARLRRPPTRHHLAAA